MVVEQGPDLPYSLRVSADDALAVLLERGQHQGIVEAVTSLAKPGDTVAGVDKAKDPAAAPVDVHDLGLQPLNRQRHGRFSLTLDGSGSTLCQEACKASNAVVMGNSRLPRTYTSCTIVGLCAEWPPFARCTTPACRLTPMGAHSAPRGRESCVV